MNNVMSKNQRRKQNARARQISTLRNIETRIINVSSRKKVKRNRRKSNGQKIPTGRSFDTTHYFKSLMDPDNYPGAKIPDLVTFPSGTFQISDFENGLDTSSTGNTVGMTIIPRIATNSNSAQDSGGLYICADSTNSSDAINWVGTDFARGDAIRTMARAYRPVSACLTGEFVGPSLNNGGYFVGGLIPTPNCPTTVNSAANTIGADTCTFHQDGGKCTIIWRPLDNSNYEYTRVGVKNVNIPSIFLIATGLPSLTIYVRFKYTINFEYIPTDEVFGMVTQDSSPVSTKALEYAANALSHTSSYMKSVLYKQVGLVGSSLFDAGLTHLRGAALRRMNAIEY